MQRKLTALVAFWKEDREVPPSINKASLTCRPQFIYLLTCLGPVVASLVAERFGTIQVCTLTPLHLRLLDTDSNHFLNLMHAESNCDAINCDCSQGLPKMVRCSGNSSDVSRRRKADECCSDPTTDVSLSHEHETWAQTIAAMFLKVFCIHAIANNVGTEPVGCPPLPTKQQSGAHV